MPAETADSVKPPLPVVDVELVGLRVVGDHQVGPAIAVHVEHRHAERLGRVVEQPGLCRSVFKLAIAEVVPQAHRRAFVRLRRAIRLVRSVERAIDVALRSPLHVVGDDQVELAVAVVIHPRRAGAELVRAPHARGLGDVGECPVAVVVEQVALPKRRDEDVVEAIVVVIADRRAHAEQRDGQSRLRGHIGERAVAIVVIELQRRWLAGRGPVLAVHQQNVGIAVIVVVDESAARAHGFRQPLLAGRAVVVHEVDAGLFGDIAESDLRGAQWKPARHTAR